MLQTLKNRLLDTLLHWQFRKNQILGNNDLRQVLELKPIKSYDDADTDVFVLTAGEDLYPLLIALKSLAFWTEQRFRFNVACDDGLLKPHHAEVIREHVEGVRLITDRAEIVARLRDYPATTKMHLDAKDPSYPKLSIPALYATKPKVILTDTDVIFFRVPQLLISWMTNAADDCDYYRNPVCVNDPYPFPALEEELRARYGIGGRPMLESGLLLFHKEVLALDRLEEVSALFDKHGFTYWSKELEIYNVLFRIRGKLVPLKRAEYGGVWTYDAAAVHYFSKHMYIRPSLLHIMSLVAFMKLAEDEGFTPSKSANM